MGLASYNRRSDKKDSFLLEVTGDEAIHQTIPAEQANCDFDGLVN
ncbi:hypothetical protein [Photobacterium sagamiensis]